jgi:hypothetical protein
MKDVSIKIKELSKSPAGNFTTGCWNLDAGFWILDSRCLILDTGF